MSEDLRIEKKVESPSSQMVIGLDGWVNAGKVSTFSVKYLINKLEAQKFGEILQGRFHDYVIQRPFVSIKEGLMRSYIPPQNALYYWKGKENSDLILLLGVEPHLDWPRYVDIMLKVAKKMNVNRIYTIGGYLADIPIEDEPLINLTTNNEKLIDELKKVGLVLTNYAGPTCIYSEILWRCKTEKIDAVSLWSAVPIHIKGIYPKAAYHMLKMVTLLTGIEVDLTDLKRKAEAFKGEFERRTSSRLEMRRLLENLKEKQKEKRPTYIL
mgnify:CR=1 FL=1